MNILFDTSTLVAALVTSHPVHSDALRRLQRVKSGDDAGFISAHSLAELYSTLTAMPSQPRIPPPVAWQLIQSNVLATFRIVSLTEADYLMLLEQLSTAGIVGGVTYDALILHAATKVAVDQIVTLNERHFQRIRPDLSDLITAP